MNPLQLLRFYELQALLEYAAGRWGMVRHNLREARYWHRVAMSRAEEVNRERH